MDCNEVKQLSKKYFSGACPDSIKVELEKHLSECVNCSIYYSKFKKHILPFLGTMVYPPQRPSTFHYERKRPTIKKKKHRFDWKRIIPNILTAISLLIIVIMLAIIQRKLVGK